MVKNPLANAGDADVASTPGSGRAPGVGNGNPLHTGKNSSQHLRWDSEGTVLSSEKWSQVDMESGIGPPWQRESLVLPVTSQCL